MNSYDKALDALSQPTQATFEASYGDFDRSKCWRCLGAPGDGPSGVCEACKALLLADLPAEEPDEPNSASQSLEIAPEAVSAAFPAISAVGGALGTLFDQLMAQIAEFVRILLETGLRGPETAENSPERPEIGPGEPEFIIIDDHPPLPDVQIPRGPVEYPCVAPHCPPLEQHWISTRWAEDDLIARMIGPRHYHVTAEWDIEDPE